LRAYKEHLVKFGFLKPIKEGYEVQKTWVPVQKRVKAANESTQFVRACTDQVMGRNDELFNTD
jgi:hypothetical protein